MPVAAGLHIYALALGSNRAQSSTLGPADLLHRVMTGAHLAPLQILARSPIIITDPIGPSLRRYANAAILVATDMPPAALLAHLKAIERQAGRRSGQRWGARPLDLDIILWSGGRVRSRPLHIPHRAFRDRLFVLEPLAAIAADWRDPVTGRTVRHLLARAKMPKPVDRRPAHY